MPSAYGGHGFHSTSAGSQGFGTPDNFQLQPPQQFAPVSRPASRTSRVRSPSPNNGRGRRSGSPETNSTASKKGRSRSSKTRGVGDHAESVNGYSSGDGTSGSVSGKTKEHLGNTEISVENIVEGGRRKRAKFESSVIQPVPLLSQAGVANSPLSPLGTSSICPAANASRCFQLIRLSSSSR